MVCVKVGTAQVNSPVWASISPTTTVATGVGSNCEPFASRALMALYASKYEASITVPPRICAVATQSSVAGISQMAI
jgi:hypothetical protein